MGISAKITRFDLKVDENIFQVKSFSYPFREGVELEVEVYGEILRVSDRQLGQEEATRILKELITRRLRNKTE